MQDVLHQLIDRVRYHSEAEMRDAHAAIDQWFEEHFPGAPDDSTVDSPAPGGLASVDAPAKGDHAE